MLLFRFDAPGRMAAGPAMQPPGEGVRGPESVQAMAGLFPDGYPPFTNATA